VTSRRTSRTTAATADADADADADAGGAGGGRGLELHGRWPALDSTGGGRDMRGQRPCLTVSGGMDRDAADHIHHLGLVRPVTLLAKVAPMEGA
jgi:hypothetical protein